MGYLFLMTFAGSALFIGYLCWKKILGKSMTQCMKYRALMMVMLAYVIPWEWLEGTYRYIIGFFWLGKVDARVNGLVNIADIEAKDIAYQTKDYWLLTIVMSVWFAIAVLILIIRVAKSWRKSHALHVLAITCEDKNLEQTLKCLRETIQYRHRPEIVWTRVDNETFTTGAIKPVIFLQKKYAEGDLYWILKHEIAHIVRLDLWVKLLLEFVCCLHWFNPLIYLLEREMRYLSETSCDEIVIKDCAEEECQAYINLLNRNKGNNRLKNPFNGISQGDDEIDRRITLMKNRKSIRGGEKAIAISAFVFLIFLDSLTALAYPKVNHIKNAVTEAAEDAVDGGNFWIYDYAEGGYDKSQEVILYDEQFVDENGEIYPADTATEQETCPEHKTVSGIVQIHEKNSEGGCTLETYEGTRCTECGTVWKGELLHRTTKIPCIH